MIVNGQPLDISGLTVSADVFRALGVQPALGRAYTAEEDLGGNSSVIVLSHEFWQRRLGGRRDVLGMTLATDGGPRTVIGVMPPGFTVVGQKADFLIPYGQTLEQLRAVRGRGSSYAIARLREGVSFEQAYSEMRSIYAELEKEEPQRNARRTVMLFRLQEQMVGELRPALFALVGAVALVLLVACVNVANLLLARSAAREREVGMRTALGAGRGRLVRQMLTESLVLAAAGGIAGLWRRGAVSSRPARAGGRSHSDSAARPGGARSAGGRVHHGHRAGDRHPLRSRSRVRLDEPRERRAARRRTSRRRPPAAPRAQHARRRRSGAVARAAGRRRPADAQPRQAAEHRSRLPRRRRAHGGRAASGDALRPPASRQLLPRIAVAHGRAAGRGARGGGLVPAGAVRRASARASGASIGRSRRMASCHPARCGRSRRDSSRRWGFHRWPDATSPSPTRWTRCPSRSSAKSSCRQQFADGRPAGPAPSDQLRPRQRQGRHGMDGRRRRRQHQVVAGRARPPDHLRPDERSVPAAACTFFVRTQQDPVLLATSVTGVVHAMEAGSAGRRPHARRGRRQHDRASARDFGAGRRVRARGARARGGRRLRRDGVFGAGADAGNRRAHGARRDGDLGAPPRARPGAAPRLDRRRRRAWSRQARSRGCSSDCCTRSNRSIRGRSPSRALVLLVVATVASYVPARRGMRMAPVDALRTN